jgi:hypothetical protein
VIGNLCDKLNEIEIKGLSYPVENPHRAGSSLNKNHEDKIEKTPQISIE